MACRKSDVFADDSSQSSIISAQLRTVADAADRTVNYEACSVLHCAKCSLVLGDSLGVCGVVKSLNSIIFLKITKHVRERRKVEVSMEGPLAFCTYKVLECCGCHRFVGLVLHATSHRWSSLRGLFLLQKEALNCYMLKSCTMVKASKISFENRLLGKGIGELMQDLETQLTHVNLLKDMLDESRIGHARDPLSSTITD